MNTLRLLTLASLTLSACSLQAQISSASYTNDFTSSASDFFTTKPAAGAWTLNTAGSGTFGHDDAVAVSGTYTASVQHTLLGGAAATALDFNFEAVVNYTATGVASGNTLGVGFLNSASNLAPASGYWLYIRGVQTGGPSIFLMRDNVAVASAGSASSELRDFIGDTFSFSVTGTYTDAVGADGIKDSLSLSATFQNVTDTLSFSLTFLDASPLSGNYFGMRADDQSPSHSLGAQWDSISISTVPEPSSYAACVGALALGVSALRRRRR